MEISFLYNKSSEIDKPISIKSSYLMAGVQMITCRLIDAVCFVIRGHLHCPCVVARSENGAVHVKQPTVCLHRVRCLQAGLVTSDAYKLGRKDSCQWIWFVLQPCSDLRKCWNLSKSKIVLVYFFFLFIFTGKYTEFTHSRHCVHLQGHRKCPPKLFRIYTSPNEKW